MAQRPDTPFVAAEPSHVVEWGELPVPEPLDRISLNESTDWQASGDFREYFMGRDAALSFAGIDSHTGPVLIFIMPTPENVPTRLITAEKDRNPKHPVYYYRALIRSRQADSRHFISATKAAGLSSRRLVKLLKHQVAPLLDRVTSLNEFERGPLDVHLGQLDTAVSNLCLKISVVRVKAGQDTEEQIMGNEDEPEDYARFLSLLGDRIELQNWSFYAGNLSTEGMHGKQSVFSRFRDFQIMFHVSHLIKSTGADAQLERKRFICNNINLIVFCEPNAVFRANTFTSNFCQNIAVVQPAGPDYYRLAFLRKNGVEKAKPYLPSPAVIPVEGTYARTFLITKLINAERAAYLSDTLRNIYHEVRAHQLQVFFRKSREEGQTHLLNRSPSRSPDSSPFRSRSPERSRSPGRLGPSTPEKLKEESRLRSSVAGIRKALLGSPSGDAISPRGGSPVSASGSNNSGSSGSLPVVTLVTADDSMLGRSQSPMRQIPTKPHIRRTQSLSSTAKAEVAGSGSTLVLLSFTGRERPPLIANWKYVELSFQKSDTYRMTPFSQRDVEMMFSNAKRMNCKSGQILSEEGKPAYLLCQIRLGEFRIEKFCFEKRNTIRRLGPADFIGDSLVFGTALEASSSMVCASEPSELLQADLHLLGNMLDADHALAARFFRHFACLIARQLSDLPSPTSLRDAPEVPPPSSPSRLLPPVILTEGDAIIRAAFHLEDEYALKEWPCSKKVLAAAVDAQGLLILTANFLCFHTKNLASAKKKNMIPLHTVEKLERDPKEREKVVLQNFKKKRRAFYFNTSTAVDEVIAVITKFIPGEVDINAPDRFYLSFFSGNFKRNPFTKDDWTALLGESAPRRYSRDQVILAEGTSPNQIFRLISGACRVEKKRVDVAADAPADPVVLGQMEAGETFGELSFLLSQSTSASVIADDNCEVYIIPAQELQALFLKRRSAEARFYLELTTVLHQRMQKRERVVYPKYSAGATAIIRRSGSQVLRNQIVRRDQPQSPGRGIEPLP